MWLLTLYHAARFKGGIYCGEWLIYAVTFRGRQDFEVWQDFEEIRYRPNKMGQNELHTDTLPIHNSLGAVVILYQSQYHLVCTLCVYSVVL